MKYVLNLGRKCDKETLKIISKSGKNDSISQAFNVADIN